MLVFNFNTKKNKFVKTKSTNFIQITISGLAIASLLALAIYLPGLASAQETTNVSVSAPDEVNSGEQFTVDILVEPGTAIAGVQFDLAFAPSLVTVDNIAEGDLLSQNGAITYFSPGTIDNVAGTITLVTGAIVIPGQTVSRAGTFATITLTAGTGSGTCPITLSRVIVGDINGQPVPVTVVNGQVIINQPSPPPSGGGGGGGGGGGAAGITLLTDYVTTDGRFTDDVTAESEDGKFILYFPEDTIGLNIYGYPLRSVSIKGSDSYPGPPEYYKIIPPVYYVTPDGATFEPPIELTISYDASLLPEQLAEKNLVVATCNISNNEWEILESIVGPEKDTIKSNVGHFSLFAVLAPLHPASFTVTDLSVTPVEVHPGEEVSISTIVTNTGSLTGNHEINLVVNDTIVETRGVTLDGGDSELGTFNLTADTVGEHVVAVGELQKTFIVNEANAPSTFLTNNLDINPAEVTIGESVTISVLVSNTGNPAGSYKVSLLIDDSVVQTKEVALNGSDVQIISFEVTPDTTGEFKVTIDGLSGSYVVKAPSSPTQEDETSKELEISNFDVAPLYNPDTGKLVSARVMYKFNKSYDMISEEELWLKVFQEETLIGVIQLLKLSQIQPDGKTGEVYYVPSQGWQVGKYSFRAELYGTEGEGLIQVTQLENINVTPEAITQAVSWKTLGILVGAAFITILAIVSLILYRRSNILRGY